MDRRDREKALVVQVGPANSHGDGCQRDVHENGLVSDGSHHSIASGAVRYENHDCFDLFGLVPVNYSRSIASGNCNRVFARVAGLICRVPIEELSDAPAEPFMHRRPFLAILAAIAKIQRWPHGVPLVINIDA